MLHTKAVIRKQGSQYCIFSKSGKKLSCHSTRKEALKRLRQIEYFKHQKGSLADVVAFITYFGNDFEPDEFQNKPLHEWVAEAKCGDSRKKKKEKK